MLESNFILLCTLTFTHIHPYATTNAGLSGTTNNKGGHPQNFRKPSKKVQQKGEHFRPSNFRKFNGS